ncbi:peptidoglycan binding domain-containing protein [Syntrophomonas wolfei]|uniref:peptidoglycan binding domain-containing protein n=1 Tax=Syntrophomonas wolfei TaxID=863 RepID=UPI0023F1FAE6|nr:peptidoglycan binding domain-containing protein [Syntrophomonas wolfei]
MTDAGKLWLKVISMAVIAISASLLIVSFALAARDQDYYPSNLWLGGISLADMSKEEAYALLQSELASSRGDKLILVVGKQEISLPMEEIGINYDIAASLDKIEEELFPGQGVATLVKHSVARGQRQEIKPVLSWNKEAVLEKVLQIKRDYDQPAVDARIVYNHDFLEYRAHQNGYLINVNASMNHISDALEKGILGPIEIIATEVHPRVKIEDIETVKDVIAVSARRINHLSPETSALLEKLNGLIIMHGEKLDLPAIMDSGCEAAMDVGSETKAQIKGAIVQACLQAGMQEKDKHSVMENKLQYPLLLTTSMSEHTLLVKIYGCQTELGKEITLLSEREDVYPEVQIKLNHRLSPQQRIIQQEGKKGFILRNYRVVTSGGKVVEKSLLSEELTPASDTIIIVGPGNIRK